MAEAPVTTIPALDPGERLLCGPGPSNVHPTVLEAMRLPMNGHLDPDFWDLLDDLVLGLRALWRSGAGGLTIALSSSGTSAMEAGFMNLIDPGDTVISCHWGFFGSRLNDFVHRVGANVVELSADFGQIVPVERIVEAVAAHPEAKLVSVVHAETSTGAEFPLAELAEALGSGSDAMLYADCVTSLAGQRVEAEAWGLDYGYSCSQKALGCPPGIAPVTISDRGIAAMQRRQGPVPYYYDFEELAKYWIDRPITYHHTMPILQYYALYTGVRLALEEGLEDRWARNEDAGRYFQDQIRDRGFELLADPEHQLVELTAVKVPEGVDGKEVQTRFLREFDLEVGGGLGPKAPPIWRVGLMGVNATRETADRVLEAFDAVVPG
jgi:alanine-glyoxylate transaminase / serine-glyoxylate transaminase / serine-pyruvate transaminase